jgi:anaerobic ribonucleoside-triphosphate reductase activating protein
MTEQLSLLAYHKHQFVPVDRTLEIYFSGCSHQCPGCHNSELWERTSDNTIWISGVELVADLMDYKDIATSVHILGGEPLDQDHQALYMFLYFLDNVGFKNIIFFTANDISQSDISKSIMFDYCSYVKVGAYDESLTDGAYVDIETGIKLASSNQKIYKGRKHE